MACSRSRARSVITTEAVSARHVVLTAAACAYTPKSGPVWAWSLLTLSCCIHFLKEFVMLSWALAFFIIAIIAAVFGFTGIAAGAAEIAKILFVVFVVLFLVSLVAGLLRRP